MQHVQHVPCNEPFWRAYSAYIGREYQGLEWYESTKASASYVIALALFYRDEPRLIINVVAIVPLLLCCVIGMSKTIADTGVRAFCWNCLFVHLVFTGFLVLKWVMNTYVYNMAERCWFDRNGHPMTGFEGSEASAPGIFVEGYGIQSFTKWTIYAVSINLIWLRLSLLRASLNPLETSRSHPVLKWCFVVVVIDIGSVLLVGVETDAYNPRMADWIRTAIAIASVMLLWLGEALLSLISVVLLVKRGKELSNTTGKPQRGLIQGFIYFAIVPSVQFVPFVYIDVMDGVTRLSKHAILKACLGEDYSLYDFDYSERADNLIKCGYDYYDERASPLKTTLNVIMDVCQCIVVWKPYVEALSVLLLLPGFRRVLLEKLRLLRNRIYRRKVETTCTNQSTVTVVPKATFA